MLRGNRLKRAPKAKKVRVKKLVLKGLKVRVRRKAQRVKRGEMKKEVKRVSPQQQRS